MTAPSSPDFGARLLSWAQEEPGAARELRAALDAEVSLREFIALTWDVLEPGRTFVTGWAVDAVCEHLQAVTDGELTRLVINVPPGCMKSLTTDVFWPAWEWGPRNRPWTRYVASSYSEQLTIRDNRRCRNLLVSPVYQRYWGDRFQLLAEQNTKTRFENDRTGFKLATSVGGLGTGERGDRFVIDDPHNIKDGESEARREAALQWFTEVVPTRINDARKSAIIVIMQRVHERDVSGLILKEELNYEWLCLPMEYERVNRCYTSVRRPDVPPRPVTRVLEEGAALPRWLTREEARLEGVELAGREFVPLTPQDRRAEEGELLWPERFPADYLEGELKPALRAWGGTYAEAGQLQQRPAPRGGGMFQRGDFHLLDHVPDGVAWVRGWDLAGTKKKRSPWTVGVKMGMWDGKVAVANVVRFRESPGEVERRLLETAELDGPQCVQSFPQDPGQAGLSQKAALARLLHGFRPHFSPETGNKSDRCRPYAAQAEAGNVYLCPGAWTERYVNELCLFPNGEFKDQADASSRAYDRIIRRRRQSLGSAPVVVE